MEYGDPKIEFMCLITYLYIYSKTLFPSLQQSKLKVLFSNCKVPRIQSVFFFGWEFGERAEFRREKVAEIELMAIQKHLNRLSPEVYSHI